MDRVKYIKKEDLLEFSDTEPISSIRKAVDVMKGFETAVGDSFIFLNESTCSANGKEHDSRTYTMNEEQPSTNMRASLA